jgi:dsRNA-specific ribonuclease
MNHTSTSAIDLEDDIRMVKDLNGSERYIFDPYNSVNCQITAEDIQSILRVYGINAPIHNLTLYKRAFIHRSYIRRPDTENKEHNIIIIESPVNCIPLSTKSNERLEFVGDGVLECITKYYLYRRFPKENEGFMTEKKIALVKNEAIGKMAFEMGLHRWFILSRHAENKQMRTNLKKLGCLFEAFIGAIFLDFNKIDILDEEGWFKNIFSTGVGFQMVQVFIETVFEKHVNWIDLIRNDDNYKNLLQVRIQKEFRVTPEYLELSRNMETGYTMAVYICLGQPIHSVSHLSSVPISMFQSFAEIHNYMSVYKKVLIFLGEGSHKIKRKAEQISCDLAIKKLQTF